MKRNMFSDYDRFAWLYNKYWGGYYADNLYAVLEDLVLKRVPYGGRVLDLCCGTGQLSHVLSTKGYSVTGVEGSKEMLRFARSAAPDCRFVRADARYFRLRGPFDAVLSTFDSLNHVMRIRELERVFRNVGFALKKAGGLFLFDLNTDDGFRARWRGSFGIVGDDHACVIRSNYDTEAMIGRYDIAMFFRRKKSTWARSDVTLLEKCHGIQEVTSALKKAGFIKIRSYDSQCDLKLREVGRVFFVCET